MTQPAYLGLGDLSLAGCEWGFNKEKKNHKIQKKMMNQKKMETDQ